MIWHIFRKDWKLLWWKAMLVAGLLVIGAIAQTSQGHFGGTSKFAIAPLVIGFGAAILLMVELVQLDPLAGAGQDWIARPVRRIDLLLAKILFIVLTLALPMLLAELVQDLAVGIPFGRALGGAAFDTVSGVLSIGLPALALASLFRNLTETIAGIFVAILMLFAVGFAIQGNARFPLAGAETGSGVQWMVDFAGSVFYFAGALVVFGIQYFRRRTILARWVTAGVFLVICITPLLPWDAAFAVEQRLSRVPGAATSANIFFNPPSGTGWNQYARLSQCVPIIVSGVAPDAWLNIDHVQVHILDDADQVLWSNRNSERLVDGWTAVRGQLRGDVFETMNGRCQPIQIPTDIINTVWNRPRRLRLDYSLTLFAPDKSYAMPAWNGDQRMPGIGWCKTRVDQTMQLGCISDAHQPCLEIWASYAANRPNPSFSCKPDYDVIRGGPDTDAWQVTLPSPQSSEDKLVLRTYKPLDHFTRQVTTPAIMPDWRTIVVPGIQTKQ